MKTRCYSTIFVPMSLMLALALTVPARAASGEKPNLPLVLHFGGAIGKLALAAATQPQDPWAQYQIILERNIFSRQRGPVRRPGEDRDTGPIVVPNPESYFVLKGIVQEDNEFIAFVEDTQTGTVLRLRRDDKVARGAIRALSLDQIEYQLEDRTTVIKLGYDLEGNLGAVAAPVVALPPVSAAPTQSGTPAPPATSSQAQPRSGSPDRGQPAPTGEEAAILQRLMEQRKQQLGQ